MEYIHQLTMSEPPQHICPQCDKKLSSARNLQQHIAKNVCKKVTTKANPLKELFISDQDGVPRPIPKLTLDKQDTAEKMFDFWKKSQLENAGKPPHKREAWVPWDIEWPDLSQLNCFFIFKQFFKLHVTDKKTIFPVIQKVKTAITPGEFDQYRYFTFLNYGYWRQNGDLDGNGNVHTWNQTGKDKGYWEKGGDGDRYPQIDQAESCDRLIDGYWSTVNPPTMDFWDTLVKVHIYILLQCLSDELQLHSDFERRLVELEDEWVRRVDRRARKVNKNAKLFNRNSLEGMASAQLAIMMKSEGINIDTPRWHFPEQSKDELIDLQSNLSSLYQEESMGINFKALYFQSIQTFQTTIDDILPPILSDPDIWFNREDPAWIEDPWEDSYPEEPTD
jgi:hypothetical protein